MSLTVKQAAQESLRTSQLNRPPDLVAELLKYVGEIQDEVSRIDGDGPVERVALRNIDATCEDIEDFAEELTKFIRKAYAVMALCGELGEFSELVKKELYHSKPAEPGKVAGELGDIKWGWDYAVAAFGLDHENVCLGNAEKLRKRYPNGYTHADCAARVDTQPIGVNAPKVLELA